ncbi:hypothetical protein BKA80DRAFT_260302 [Phyllosticta citrichinensis]
MSPSPIADNDYIHHGNMMSEATKSGHGKIRGHYLYHWTPKARNCWTLANCSSMQCALWSLDFSFCTTDSLLCSSKTFAFNPGLTIPWHDTSTVLVALLFALRESQAGRNTEAGAETLLTFCFLLFHSVLFFPPRISVLVGWPVDSSADQPSGWLASRLLRLTERLRHGDTETLR